MLLRKISTEHGSQDTLSQLTDDEESHYSRLQKTELNGGGVNGRNELHDDY